MNLSVLYLLVIFGKGVVLLFMMVCYVDDFGLVCGDGVFDIICIVIV